MKPYDPYTTRSTHAAAYAIALGHQPCSVVALPGGARRAVEFRFATAEARDCLAEFYRGSEEATLVPARRFSAAINQANDLAKAARLGLAEDAFTAFRRGET